MGEWNEATISDVCLEIKSGGTPLTKISEYYVGGTIPWLKTKEVLNNRIDSTENYITEAGLKNSSAKLIPPNSIIVAMYGDGDTAGRVATNKIPLTTNQACCNLIINPDIAVSDFVFYALLGSYDQLVGLKTGSGQQNLNAKLIRDYRFPLPSIAEQKAIAEVLSSLDDKIDLLHRQNKTLESLAQTLFRLWFIEQADDSWENGVITDLVELNPKRILAKGTVAPYLEMSNLSNSLYHPTDWYDREFSSGTKFKNGDTLLARITPCLENGKTGFVDFLENDHIGWGSTEFIVMRAKEPLHPFFTYIMARHQDFRDFAIGCMVGSSGRQRADVDNLATYEIKIPPTDVIDRFNSYIEPSLKKMKLNNKQVRDLVRLRDSLLPKLMSGEVTLN